MDYCVVGLFIILNQVVSKLVKMRRRSQTLKLMHQQTEVEEPFML